MDRSAHQPGVQGRQTCLCQECVPQVPRAFDSLWLDERPKGAGVDGEGNIGEPQCKKNGAEAQNSQRKLGRGTCEVKRQSKQSGIKRCV